MAVLHFYILGGALTTYSLWESKKDSVSWQSVYQLALATGSIFGPLIAEPFLLEQGDSVIVNNATSNITRGVVSPDDTQVMFAFTIAGACTFVVGIISLLAFGAFQGIYVYGQKKGKNIEQKDIPRKLAPIRMTYIVLLICYYMLQSLFLRIYSQYIVVFTVNYLNWSKSQGAALLSAYSAAGLVCRFINIFLVRYVKLEIQIFAGLILCNLCANVTHS